MIAIFSRPVVIILVPVPELANFLVAAYAELFPAITAIELKFIAFTLDPLAFLGLTIEAVVISESCLLNANVLSVP